MRIITQEATNAFHNAENYKKSNTEVKVLFGKVEMRLHGNLIAISENGELKISTAGWASNTTKERLNGITGVKVQHIKKKLHLNGEEWDGDWVTIS